MECRWSKKITQVHLLVSATEHVFQLPSVCRAAVSAEILKKFVVPVISALMRLEEADPSAGSSPVSDTSASELLQESISLPSQVINPS